MATVISEFFGYSSTDHSPQALDAAHRAQCPFLQDQCTKVFRDGLIAGVCTLKPTRAEPVICCPNRLYADDYQFLHDISDRAFAPGLPLRAGGEAQALARETGLPAVAVFGKRWSGELHLPQREGTGSYFVDWILARLEGGTGTLIDFVAVEVQSIDTTGNYRDARLSLLDDRTITQATAGFNWENVSKRILPQVLYKGHVLQRESKCLGGLFFVTPNPVYNKIMQRLGGEGALVPYPLKSSTITFMAYDPDWEKAVDGQPVPLRLVREFTTDTGQVAQAFAGPGVMPPMGCYESAIEAALT